MSVGSALPRPAVREVAGVVVATVGAGAAAFVAPPQNALHFAFWVWAVGLAMLATSWRVMSVTEVLVAVLGLPATFVGAAVLGVSGAETRSCSGDGHSSPDQVIARCQAHPWGWHAAAALLPVALVVVVLCANVLSRECAGSGGAARNG